MLKMLKILTVSVLGFGLVSCTKPEPEIQTVYINTPVVAPTVPRVDVLTLRPVDWIVITPENVTEQLAKNNTLFALNTQSYENLALNISDIRANIDQYRAIITIYEESYE